jgi:hypothetical protein
VRVAILSLLAMFTAHAGMFPPLKASNLEKTELNLPEAFEGEVNLVLIAFERRQQKDVDTWLAALPGIQKSHPGLEYYELPTIKRMNPLTRWFIDNGMRSGIPDKKQRARTITLYIDKEPFKKALNLPAEDTIYALLLDKTGQVIWRESGRCDAAKGKSLEDFLNARGAK